MAVGDDTWSQYCVSVQVGGMAGSTIMAGGTGEQATGTAIVWNSPATAAQGGEYPGRGSGDAAPDPATWEWKDGAWYGRNLRADDLGFDGYVPPASPMRKPEVEPTLQAPAAPLPRRKLYTEE